MKNTIIHSLPLSNKFDSIYEYQCLEYIQNLIGCIIPKRSKLKISITDDQQIMYSQNGQIIRIDKKYDQNPILLTNIIQIKHLQWVGENSNKIGHWIATLQGQAIVGSGGYYCNDGKKQGEWSDLIQNYSQISNVYEIGLYNNDVRLGIWKYKYQNEFFKGGIYNQLGIKQGTWIDLSQQFWDFGQITFGGEYKDGIKIGQWDINYREQNYKQFEKIGGGQFDNHGFKKNKWIESSNNFWDQSQLVYKGEYKNDLKVGLWDIYYKKNFTDTQKIVGQGLFDEQGMKNGYWIEPYFGFYKYCYVTFNGIYQHGKKIASWLIKYRRDINNQQQEIIGGGNYNHQGLKVGYWTELSNCFYLYNQIVYKGEYLHGLKYGIWEIKHRRDKQEYFERVGGGFYDEYGKKNGEWIDLTEDYYQNITYCGQYQNDQKVGRWEINHRNSIDDQNHTHGIGEYNEIGYKNNKWIDLSENFNLQVTYDGEYRCGQKIGIWNTNFRRIKGKQPEIIGGGSYDHQMLKYGRWVELSDNFYEYCQVSYEGFYNRGLKFGRWNVNYKENGQTEFSNIGGGIYNQQSIKDGEWIEISDHFEDTHQVIYKGEYKNGLKFGRWNILYRKNSQNLFQQIGGGQYNQSGLKRGQWIDVCQNYSENLQVIYQGEFIEDQKIGLWDTFYKRKQDSYQKLIEYGLYDYCSQKQGKWFEMSSDFYEDYQSICIGEYKNNKKFGNWNMMQINNEEFEID